MKDDPKSKAYHEAIGRVVVASAYLELGVIMLHAHLLETPYGIQALAGESFDTARQGCLRLAKLYGGERQHRVEEAVNRAKSAWDDRAAVVHGQWVAFANDPPDRRGTMRTARSGQRILGRS
jgi:hypothetical protein